MSKCLLRRNLNPWNFNSFTYLWFHGHWEWRCNVIADAWKSSSVQKERERYVRFGYIHLMCKASFRAFQVNQINSWDYYLVNVRCPKNMDCWLNFQNEKNKIFIILFFPVHEFKIIIKYENLIFPALWNEIDILRLELYRCTVPNIKRKKRIV